ncbi:putative DNA oxidative demethylase ALKBH1 [Hypsibius exemplaris]|uniref:DNA oxidative demethylase ALKBH1 n=1 Tax=Hypsibius exemplaris TaxID=2072580 RepID=A0A1W0WNR9_HYPEX|nr:putative DNA oxidative demethylase ALKBH1 [Hypsibius exemplaris]
MAEFTAASAESSLLAKMINGDKTFKAAFKFFKSLKGDVAVASQKANVDIIDAADCALWDQLKSVELSHGDNPEEGNSLLEEFGLVPVEEWEAKEIPSCPGGIILRSPFTRRGERSWIEKSLWDYPGREDLPSNLDRHWEWTEQSRSSLKWWPASSTFVSDALPERPKKRRKHDWKADKNKSLAAAPIWKLRWITLGYHHDWDSKLYSEDKKTPFPDDVNCLCRFLARRLGYREFSAEAAIVNYYHLDSTLSPHQDVSEPYQEAPLISISFGQPAVFLIGADKADWPSAVILRSGDVFVMTGPSRLAFHGVPKVFADPKWQLLPAREKTERDALLTAYLAHSRINLNVRQVLPPGQTCLPRLDQRTGPGD